MEQRIGSDWFDQGITYPILCQFEYAKVIVNALQLNLIIVQATSKENASHKTSKKKAQRGKMATKFQYHQWSSQKFILIFYPTIHIFKNLHVIYLRKPGFCFCFCGKRKKSDIRPSETLDISLIFLWERNFSLPSSRPFSTLIYCLSWRLCTVKTASIK